MRALFATATLVLAMLTATAPAAGADIPVDRLAATESTEDANVTDNGDFLEIVGEESSSAGGAASPDAAPVSSGPAKCLDKLNNNAEVPCTDGDGGWWGGTCYLGEVPEGSRPPKSDPIWGGNTDGSIYGCGDIECVGVGAGDTAPSKCQTAYTNLVWLGTPPGPQNVDVEAIAEKMVKNMALRAPEIGITPKPNDPDSVGAVGLPIYLWIADADNPRVFGEITDSAETSNVLVEVTARAVDVEWDMGNGDAFTCDGPGTPYEARFGKEPSPDCGYMYEEQGDPYTVTATVRWEADWTGAGRGDTIETSRTSEVNIRIGEYQALRQ